MTSDPPVPRPAAEVSTRASRAVRSSGRRPGPVATSTGTPRPPRPPRRLVAAAAIIADGAVLAARRTAPPAVAGRWELPGGKVEPGETPERAAVREVREELGVAVRVGRRLGRRHPIRPGMSLVVVLAELLEPAPTTSVVHDRLRWLRADELDEVDWLPADRPLLDLLRVVLTEPRAPQAPPPDATPAQPASAHSASVHSGALPVGVLEPAPPTVGAAVRPPAKHARGGRRPRGRRRGLRSAGAAPPVAGTPPVPGVQLAPGTPPAPGNPRADPDGPSAARGDGDESARRA